MALDLPYFGVAIRKEVGQRDPSIPKKLDMAMADCIAGILGNLDEAVKIVGERSGIPPAVLKESISSGRLEFKHISMSADAGRKTWDARDNLSTSEERLRRQPEQRRRQRNRSS